MSFFVCLFVSLPIHLYVCFSSSCLSVCLSVSLSVCLPASLSVYLSVFCCLPVNLFICLSPCLPVFLSVVLFVCLLVYLSISVVCFLVSLYVRLSFFLSVCLCCLCCPSGTKDASSKQVTMNDNEFWVYHFQVHVLFDQ